MKIRETVITAVVVLGIFALASTTAETVVAADAVPTSSMGDGSWAEQMRVEYLSDGATTLVIEPSYAIAGSILAVLDTLGHPYSFIHTENFLSIDFSSYDTVILGMDGGYVHEDDMAYLADHINAGAKLILFGGSNYTPFAQGLNNNFVQINTASHGWKKVSGGPHFAVIDPNHPLSAGLPLAYDFANYSATFYMARITDPLVTVVAENGDAYACFLTKPVGEGLLIFFINSPAEGYWGAPADFALLGTILQNALGYRTSDLQVEPASQFISVGEEGGPFTPECKTYTLTNDGPNSLDWTAAATEAWLNVTPGSGMLTPSASATVDVCINASANVLPAGDYTDIVTFTDVTSGTAQTRDVTLRVGMKRILAYIEYTDTIREYPNTMAAIDSECPDYTLTELADYTQLSSVLPGHNVLLIPEQEKASSTQLEAIGAAWATILQEFVGSGGVVIQCDDGGRYGILTGAGLMDITASGGCTGALWS
ncbi:MAG: BACON domain-containing protein [Planctomycetota bacterium]|jgi:hypothetical protein